MEVGGTDSSTRYRSLRMTRAYGFERCGGGVGRDGRPVPYGRMEDGTGEKWGKFP